MRSFSNTKKIKKRKENFLIKKVYFTLDFKFIKAQLTINQMNMLKVMNLINRDLDWLSFIIVNDVCSAWMIIILAYPNTIVIV